MFKLKTLFVLLLTVGCGTSDKHIVAEVGHHTISEETLRAFANDQPAIAQEAPSPDEARRQYLQALIDRRLLLLEAETRGLDTTATVRHAVAKAVGDMVRALYKAQSIKAEPNTEQELRRYFEREGFAKERKLSAILVETRGAIDTIISALDQGRSFEELARAYSIDERSSRQGGELGFIGR